MYPECCASYSVASGVWPKSGSAESNGDIHEAYVRSFIGKTLFNVGSVGNPHDMAQRLVAQAPRRVIDWLEATGAGNSPRLIERVIEWAEARERR